LIPFLSEIRDGGVIYKFVVKKNKIEISLKKNKNRPKFNHNHKKIRSFDISEALYKDPSLLIFVSTAQGIRTNCCFKGQPKKAGGIQLFFTN
jgi:hypothetical protein